MYICIYLYIFTCFFIAGWIEWLASGHVIGSSGQPASGLKALSPSNESSIGRARRLMGGHVGEWLANGQTDG